VEMLLSVGLCNALAACVLAVLAAGVGYFCRRPAVRHALWLLVLLKLVTPPLVDVRVWRPAEPDPAAESETAPADDLPVLGPEALAPPSTEDVGPPPVVEEAPADVAAEPVPDRPEDLSGVLAPDRREEVAAAPALEWQPLAAAVWLGGAFLWLMLAALRAWRFSRLLRFAKAAPATLQREADGLARQLGLMWAPTVRLLPGRVSPMLWAPGWTTQLLLPAQLLARLDADARRTLLTHELAHLRRYDHRVRLLELAVTALFWWHPVVWWARRELREAEEQCCDAWVLWALPRSARTYALALVETVDFLSETRPALPVLASGVGHVRDLRRRVTMIMQGTTPRALTWGGLLTLFGLGAFLLPVMPTWAQQGPGDAPRIAVIADVDARFEDVKVVQADVQDVQRLKAELAKKRAELAQMEAQLKAAQERMGKTAAGGEKESTRRIIIEFVEGGKAQRFTLPVGSRVLGEKRESVVLGLDALRATVVDGQAKLLVIEVVGADGKRKVIELPPGSRVLSGGDQKPLQVRVVRPALTADAVQVVPLARPGPVPMGLRYGFAENKPVDADKRIADLEKKLDEVMRAVKELRGDLHKAKPGGGIPPLPADPLQGIPPLPADALQGIPPLPADALQGDGTLRLVQPSGPNPSKP